MDPNIENIEAISSIARPFIEPIFNTLVKPHLKKLNKWVSKKDTKDKIEDLFWENKFKKYLETIYRDSLFVTTLVFPNSQTKLKELYVPLTIVQANSNEHFKIDTFDFSIFDKFGKIVISDYAGMGKSTILKWITASIIEQKKSVPILIELRKIDSGNSILDEIFNQINPIDESFDKELIYQLLDLGFFTILLDGFDEIPYDFQEEITVQLSSFIKKTGKNNFIITSRPESALSTFSDFQLFYIQPLTEKEAYSLIKKLDELSKIKFGQNLINEIKEKNTPVKEFLTNPFLVSLLYKSYTYNKDIPSKKITFYEEVYSCLFKHHDLSKSGFKRPKRSRLDIFDFELILRDIAFETSKIGKVIYSKDELINHVSKAKSRHARLEFKEQQFLDDLVTTVPIFAKEGLKIKWAHKSIQDFFAAKYISNHSRKEEIISVIFKSGKYNYLNILDLLYELEYKLFRKIIIHKIIEKFISYYESQFLKKPAVSQELIDERIALLFGSDFCILKVKHEIGFEEARNIFTSALKKKNNALKLGATFHHSDPQYYSMNELSLDKQILKILRLKNENLFLDKQPKSDHGITKHLNAFSFGKAYVVDDDLTQPYNDVKKFSSINTAIARRLWTFSEREQVQSFSLDYQKCINELKEINEEIKKDSEIDLFSNI